MIILNTQEYITFIPTFLSKLKDDGMSNNVIDTSKWVINHFKKYCIKNNIDFIDMEVIKKFYEEQYDFNIYDVKCTEQLVIRRPLLMVV